MSSPTGKAPSRIRLSLFVFLVVYPLVTTLLYVAGPLTPDWQMWQRTLIIVPMVVLSMVYVIIPRIHRHCHRWL
ncbi:hypothetical protein ACX9MO_12175 [Pseudooceanicola sp. 502str34]|uniref:hypothetical protein n=1 Tax=Maritimibacter alkaliphilus TaxID=404236 RepID=UPI001C97C94A|nr:hypothetical protein [Maritimibacter alkaliphilus]MBY6091901.1 hypothetical protein [Maritimibacter alkaliphilus]